MSSCDYALTGSNWAYCETHHVSIRQPPGGWDEPCPVAKMEIERDQYREALGDALEIIEHAQKVRPEHARIICRRYRLEPDTLKIFDLEPDDEEF